MKVAIVYDRVNKWGGAERLLLALNKMFPNAPLYTSVYDKKNASWAERFPEVKTSFLQKIPFAKKIHEFLAVLMPIAFESFDFSEYDLVISVTSESAKGIITKPGIKHICICLTPTRYLWSHYQDYFKNPLLRFISSPFVKYLKNWEKVSSMRPDRIIAISKNVQERIAKYYGRTSEVIYPPAGFDRNYSAKAVKENYYLVVSRLVGYKKVELAVDVFNKNKKKLLIIGKGHQYLRLRLKAKSNIRFIKKVPDEALADYYSSAKALIMPQEEDFGLVSVEAQSLEVPVISFAKGGASETVVDGKTGVLFDHQNAQGLTAAIAKFEKIVFNHSYIRRNAERFAFKSFEKKIKNEIGKLLGNV